MRIKSVSLAKNESDRISEIFKQLGCKEKQHNGQTVLSIRTTPDVMSEKVQIAMEQLRRLGYDRSSQSQKHFWYLSDKHKHMDTITIESQGGEGFVQDRHEFLIYW